MPLKKLITYLDDHDKKYVVVKHSPAFTAQEVAASAHVPGKEMIKTVMVKVDGDLKMVVLPSTHDVDFDAVPGDHLTFATMLAATNDLFFGPSDEGIVLFDEDENPVTGDVSSQIYLWDAGTEVNEEPAIGPNTVTNQTGPDTGMDENGNVRRITDVNDGFTYPSTQSIIRVTITAN